MQRKAVFLLFIWVLTSDLCANPILRRDSLTGRHKFFICTYPSTIFVGDASLGVEHQYKRFGHEISMSYKAFKMLRNYKFDQGSTLRYDLKFKFFIRKNHSLSLNASYIYTQKSLDNKALPYRSAAMVYKPEFEPSIYLTYWKETHRGPGIGFSYLASIYKHFFWGINFGAYYTTVNFHYIAKQHISGPETQIEVSSGTGTALTPLSLPYEIKSEGRHKIYFNLLLKIAYKI